MTWLAISALACAAVFLRVAFVRSTEANISRALLDQERRERRWGV